VNGAVETAVNGAIDIAAMGTVMGAVNGAVDIAVAL